MVGRWWRRISAGPFHAILRAFTRVYTAKALFLFLQSVPGVILSLAFILALWRHNPADIVAEAAPVFQTLFQSTEAVFRSLFQSTEAVFQTLALARAQSEAIVIRARAEATAIVNQSLAQPTAAAIQQPPTQPPSSVARYTVDRARTHLADPPLLVYRMLMA